MQQYEDICDLSGLYEAERYVHMKHVLQRAKQAVAVGILTRRRIDVLRAWCACPDKRYADLAREMKVSRTTVQQAARKLSRLLAYYIEEKERCDRKYRRVHHHQRVD